MPDTEATFLIVDAEPEDLANFKHNLTKRWEVPETSPSIFKLAAGVGNMSLNVVEKFVGKPIADSLAVV